MEDSDRAGLLQMSPVQLADVARACNRYPNVEVGIEVENAEELVFFPMLGRTVFLSSFVGATC